MSPVEAFQIVGRESFGPDWHPDCVNDPDSEHRRIALKNLRAALQSGQVNAFWHDFDHERELTPIDAAGEFFRVNLDDNCIHLSFFAGKPIQCGIHADQLATFIRSEGATSTKLTVGAESACFQWLLAMMSGDGDVPKRDVLRQMAGQEFPGLSGAAYDRARRRAIEHSGRQDLSKSGRRPSTPKSNR
mgnify:CR=1 FL=1